MRKLSSLASLLIGAFLVAPSGAGAASADDLATRRLIDQAMHWQKKGRDDLAAGIWQKLLKADPANPDALVELGQIEIRAGKMQEARGYLERAKALPNPPKRLGDLETALVSGTKPTELAAARKEAAAGNSEQAVSRYQSVIGSNAKPEGQLGLEYYQTLGGTKAGWDEARRGLENLAQKNPGDERYLLALARHLTYREGTRREGIRQLSALANRSTNSDEAQKAWRQALVWLGNSPSDAPLYTAYLRRYPSDEIVRERLTQTERAKVVKPVYRPDPEQLARQSGFRKLNAGDVTQAENKFISLLQKHPRDAEALAGLGIVRLRQEKFSEAVQLLDQAIKLGGNSSRWASARRSALYWRDLQPILAAQGTGSLDTQEKALRQVIKLDPAEPTAHLLLADLASERKDFREAESIYRKVLRKSPSHPQALRGLVSVLIETGRDQEVEQLLARIDSSNAEPTGGMLQAKASMLVSIAEAEERAGRLDNALASLEDALLLDPASAKVRFALAKIYQRLGDSAAATALMDDIEATNPEQTGTHEMRANLLAEQKRWWDALQELEKLPPSRRTPATSREQKRYWVNVQVERARQFFAKGAHRDAQSVLSHVEQAAGNDTGLQALVATAWSDIGQTSRALRILRQVASRGVVSTAAKLQYAGILLGVRQDVELLAVLRELSSVPNLSLQEQTELNNLITAYTLRRADSLRESGRIAEAYDVLQPALQQSSDPRLLMALARIYDSGKEPENALRIAEDVILREPDVIDHRLFAAMVASSARLYDRAAEHAEAALAIAPDHPRVLAAAGRVEKARGNMSRAMEYFQYAQALEKDSRAFAGVPGNLALRLVDQQGLSTDRPGMLDSRRNNNLLPLPKSSAQTNLPQAATFYPVPANVTNEAQPAKRGLTPSTRILSLPRTAEPTFTSPPPVRVRPVENRNNQILPLSRNTVEPNNQYFFQPVKQEIAEPILPAASNRFFAANDRVEKLPPLPANAPASSTERTIAEEIRDISLRTSTTLSAGGGFRSRSGEAGMSRMTAFESAIEARLPLDFDTAVVLRLTPVLLDAGRIDLAQAKNATRFGSAGLGAFLSNPYPAISQEDSGIAISAAVQSENINADVGTTPLGFATKNVVGGFSLTGDFDGLKLKGGISRRPVTDSVLSYAGTVDPRTGSVWGGVLKTGGNLDLTIGDETGGIYGGLGAYSLTGNNVKDNRLLEFGIGGYWQAYQTTDTKVTLGLNFTSLSYQHNLSQFTLGHGGYFSPQRYIALGMPFDVAGRRGRLSFQVGGDIGIRSIKQDETPYYPDDDVLQSNWIKTVNSLSGIYPTSYAGSSSSGLGYKLFANFEYRINNKFVMGGRFSTDNSNNYNQQQGLIYIRHAFDGLPQAIPLMPKPLRLFSEKEAL